MDRKVSFDDRLGTFTQKIRKDSIMSQKSAYDFADNERTDDSQDSMEISPFPDEYYAESLKIFKEQQRQQQEQQPEQQQQQKQQKEHKQHEQQTPIVSKKPMGYLSMNIDTSMQTTNTQQFNSTIQENQILSHSHDLDTRLLITLSLIVCGVFAVLCVILQIHYSYCKKPKSSEQNFF